MASIPMDQALILAGVLFGLGLIGVLVRRNILFMLLSIEIMLNASALAFVVAGSRWAQPDGQVMFIFILTMAASEVAVGLASCCSFTTSSKPGRRRGQQDERVTCSTSCGSSPLCPSPVSLRWV